MNICCIDDELHSIEALIEEIKETSNLANATTQTFRDFADFSAKLSEIRPDLVVLDLNEGALTEKKLTGMDVLLEIWSNNFCPVVVYSAYSDEVQFDERLPEDHPFIAWVKKGSGSELEVIKKIESFQPHIAALDHVKVDFSKVVNDSLKGVAEVIFLESDNPSDQASFLARSARRHVAASLDDYRESEESLAEWECYVFPPIAAHLLSGDILKLAEGNSEDPSSFRVVISPSCELATRGTQNSRIDQVLTAGCDDVRLIYKHMNIAEEAKDAKATKKLRSLLNQGYQNSIVPLPGLPNRFPPLTLSFRELQLIDCTEIDLVEPNGGRYIRIASMDSPFREMLMWAFVLYTGRPGLPVRDIEKWSASIIKECKKRQGGNS